MNQSHLDRAVARATGESAGLIRRLGFSLLADGTSPGVYRPRVGRPKRCRRRVATPLAVPSLSLAAG